MHFNFDSFFKIKQNSESMLPPFIIHVGVGMDVVLTRFSSKNQFLIYTATLNNTCTNGWMDVQWKPLNVITLECNKRDNINRVITITGFLFIYRKKWLNDNNNWFYLFTVEAA